MKNTTALLVLGMHRSGTSALTGSLNQLGVALGSDMRAPHAGVNDKGYWEHLGILRVQERLLADLGSSWDDVRPLPDDWWSSPEVAPHRAAIRDIVWRDFRESPLWAVKDPRTCRLVPLWIEVFEELGCRRVFLLAHRNPLEVAKSLTKRDQFTLQKGVHLWVENNLAAERATRGETRAFLSFDALLQEGPSVFSRIEKDLEIRFPRSPQDATADLKSFLTPNLRHHLVQQTLDSVLPPAHAELVRRVMELLNECENGEDSSTTQEWREAQFDYLKLAEQYEGAFTNHISDLQLRIRELENCRTQMESSVSWQLTRPLRKIERLFSRNPLPRS